jgi:hypothetical protein
MKNLFLVFAILNSILIFAQEEDTPKLDKLNSKHEVRIDGLEALVIPNIEINYEYIISKYSGAGAAISFSLNEDFSDYQKYAFTPYYRQYFLNKKEYGARGLFVEGLLQFAGGDDYYINFVETSPGVFEDVDDGNWFNAGIGLAIGQKWVSNNGFVFELSGGGGRYLLNTDNSPDAFFRGGFLVGYRF